MSVKCCNTEKGVILCLGKCDSVGKKQLAICSTGDSTGGLFISVPQRYGSAESNINTCNARISLSGLGDITNEYHSLVIVHAKNQRNGNKTWKTGTFGIYWDGKYKGSIVNQDSGGLEFMDNLRYGAIYNRVPEYRSNDSYYYPNYVEPDQASGLAFQDVRFYTKVLTSAEARAYAERFPAAVQAKTPGFAILIR